jgi:hypothetical protein
VSDVGDKAADKEADDQVAAAPPPATPPSADPRAADAPAAGESPAGESPAGEPAAGESSAGESSAGEAAAGESPADESLAASSRQPDDDRAELERLRAEVAELRNGGSAPRGRRRGRWRAPVAIVLIVLGCVLAPVSVLAVWTANQISDTNRYVQNVAPLIKEPAVQSALTEKITTQINTRLNVQGLTNQAADTLTSRGFTRVGTLLHTFSGQLAGAVGGFVHTQVAKIVASPQVASLWVQVQRTAHAQLVKALSGQGKGAVTISNGQVVVNLAPFIDLAKKRLAARGFTIVNNIPAVNPTLALFSAKYLVKAQTGYRLINNLKIVLPILSLLLLGAGIYIARGHRRALIGAGLGLAASMLILGIVLAIARSIYLNSVPSNVLPADAAAVLYDTLVRFIKDGLRVILVVGLIVAIAAFFTGPSATAVGTRRGISKGLSWLRTSGESHGMRTGPVGRWVYQYRHALRIAAVALFGLIFVFQGRPTVGNAILLAVLLLVVLGLIELLGHPPARSAAEPQAVGPADG